jgi:hypothetical protein
LRAFHLQCRDSAQLGRSLTRFVFDQPVHCRTYNCSNVANTVSCDDGSLSFRIVAFLPFRDPVLTLPLVVGDFVLFHLVGFGVYASALPTPICLVPSRIESVPIGSCLESLQGISGQFVGDTITDRNVTNSTVTESLR